MFSPWVGKIPWRREQQPTPIFWPGEFHGLYNPWGCKELDMTEQLSLSGVMQFLVSVDKIVFAFMEVSDLTYVIHLMTVRMLPFQKIQYVSVIYQGTFNCPSILL